MPWWWLACATTPPTTTPSSSSATSSDTTESATDSGPPTTTEPTTPQTVWPCTGNEEADYSGTIVDGMCFTDEDITTLCGGTCPTFDEVLPGLIGSRYVDYGILAVYRCTGEESTGGDYDIVEWNRQSYCGGYSNTSWYPVGEPEIAEESASWFDTSPNVICCGGTALWCHPVHHGPALTTTCAERVDYDLSAPTAGGSGSTGGGGSGS